MISIENKENCCGCEACAQICPRHCIVMQADSEGFWYPEVNTALCIHCDLCRSVCPVIHSAEDTRGQLPKAYAAFNKEQAVRMASSSGGIFSALAEKTIEDHGVVFGVSMSEDCYSAEHIGIQQQEQLPALYGSKYVQSSIGNSYKDAEKYLKENRKVLFCGTPCEIEGLKNFLKEDYENLVCADFICHGVPSPKLWKKFANWEEKETGAKMIGANFRNKKRGWKEFSLSMDFRNKRSKVEPLHSNGFLRMFSQNLCLRPSCYNCKFKKMNRVSDVTLADFWGGDRVVPEMDDNTGLSMVLVHTDKGLKQFEALSDKIVSKKVDCKNAVKYNNAVVCSAKKPSDRDAFMSALDTMEFDDLAMSFLPRESMKSRVKWFLKRVLPQKFLSRIKNFGHSNS